MANLSKYFVNGMVILVPISITISVVWGLIRFADSVVYQYLPFHTPGSGLIVIFGLILCIGWLSTYWLTRKFVEWGEGILGTIPIVKTIYGSVKQMSAAVFDSQKLLKQVVLIPYPHPDVKTLGFIMADVEEPVSSALPEDSVCVFIPMSLNLTAGFNVFVPRKDIIRLNVTPESALQYIFTAGSIMPRENEGIK
jgi:uncharacterized membrane protein